MSAAARFLPLVVVACSLAVGVSAQDATTSPSTTADQPAASPARGRAANPIVKAPGSPEANAPVKPAAPHAPREISAGVAAQLAAAIPKYTPPPPKPPPDEEQVDLRDVDKPKNHIVRLPRYVVHAPPPPVFSERAIHTKKGLADVAMKRYFTEGYRALNAFTLPLFGASAEQRAMAMYEEDERLKNMSELSDDVGLVSATDKAAGAYVKRQADQTFMRPGEFDWKPLGR
ncbi:MAG TPA: hypothetical protein VHE61_03290 [Opitutaceae bacterium]|nr:hypothetical protein [Opitutaceae bacterium]